MSASHFAIRAAEAEDAPLAAAVARAAFARVREWFPEAADLTAESFALLMQTGSAFLVAEGQRGMAGVVRHWDDEGMQWFDMLGAVESGAGLALLRAVERLAQDHGLRYVRTRLPEDGRTPDVFRYWGYLGVARFDAGPAPLLEVERRVPLLTVRETRREDADAIEALTGEEAWVFEQGSRPGWFVASDGERVVGAISVAGRDEDEATLATPVLLPDYHGRGLEAWMLERAAEWAGRHGAAVVAVEADETVERAGKSIEDHGWYRDDGPPVRYVKRIGGVLRALDEPGLGDDW